MRKATNGEATVIHIRIDKALKTDLEKVAAKKGMTPSAYARWIIARVLEGEKIKGNQSV